MSKYQITLTPVDKFFFGGDMTFKVNTNSEFDNERYSSYIIKSSLFPQQTSLLGMLRFLILRHDKKAFNGANIIDQAEAEKLIGPKSFSVNTDGHQKNNFGKISSIHHVRIRRITKGKKKYDKESIATIDMSIDLEFAPFFGEISFDQATTGKYNFDNNNVLHNISIPDIKKEEYSAKNGLDVFLTDGLKKYTLDEIFVEDHRIGVDRDIYTGKTADGALFKQISYRFNNEKTYYCFVFDADLEIEDMEKYSGELVTVGGDNSQFVINISKKIEENHDIDSLNNAVYLLSPTYLTREEARMAKFAVTKLMPFRFLKSNMYEDAKAYHIVGGKMKRSTRYELYEPGSVFYFDSETQKQNFIQKIEEKKEFTQIGYNEYK